MGNIFRAMAIIIAIVFVILAFLCIWTPGGILLIGVLVFAYMPYYIIMKLIDIKEQLDADIDRLENMKVRLEDRAIENRKGVNEYEY